MSHLDRLKAKLAEQKNSRVLSPQQPPEPPKASSGGFGGGGAPQLWKHKASEKLVAVPRQVIKRDGTQPQGAALNIIAEWRAGIAQLDLDQIPCFGYRSEEDWAATYRNIVRFLDEYGAEAVRCGWSTLDLFGIAPGIGPYFAPELCGALVVPWHGRALAVTHEWIKFERLLYNKRPLPGTAAIWDCDVWGLLETPEGRRERSRAQHPSDYRIREIESGHQHYGSNDLRNINILG